MTSNDLYPTVVRRLDFSRPPKEAPDEHELHVQVMTAPPDALIRAVQGYFDTAARLDALQAAIATSGGCEVVFVHVDQAGLGLVYEEAPKGYRGMWCGVPLWEDDTQADGGVFVFQPADHSRAQDG